MLKRMDAYLIEKLDRVTTKLQKKGIKLTHIHVVAMVLTMFANIANNHGDPLGTVFSGVVWGAWLYGYQKWANENSDYSEVQRKMLSLNARVMLDREFQIIVRVVWFMIWPIDILKAYSEIRQTHYLDAVVTMLSIVTPTLCWYLNCCTFLGPGEFAKQKQEHTNRSYVNNEI